MIDIEDRDFFDQLFQLWSKTTGAENKYWMPEEDESGAHYWITAVGENGANNTIASLLSDEDADFITAVHGCLPDLVRRLHMALDEADRADYDRDERECRIFELELENQSLREELERLTEEIRR